MFQYNLYSYLRDKYPGIKVLADVRWFYTDDEHHGFELRRIFENTPGSDFRLEAAGIRDIYSVSGQIPTPVRGILARPSKFLLGPVNRRLRESGKRNRSGTVLDALCEKINPETVLNPDPGRDYYIFGFFTEEIYYRDRLDKLKREFVFPPLTGENEELAREMDSLQSVSVHIRRGDYLSKTYADQFLCLERDYYESAVSIMRQHMDAPHFYMFSEDPGYVKEAFDWLEDKTIVDINTGNDSFRDMQLMSRCKGNIIANSTFSQWASILNVNPGHITVYPAKYMSDEDTEIRTLPGWIRV